MAKATRAERHQPKLPSTNETATSQGGVRLTCNPEPAELLIDRGDMDPNRADNRGQTLSHYEGTLGHEEILMRPLGRKDAELNGGNNEGLKPLAGAVRGGYVGTVKMLQRCPGFDLNLVDGDGRLPHC